MVSTTDQSLAFLAVITFLSGLEGKLLFLINQQFYNEQIVGIIISLRKSDFFEFVLSLLLVKLKLECICLRFIIVNQHLIKQTTDLLYQIINVFNFRCSHLRNNLHLGQMWFDILPRLNVMINILSNQEQQELNRKMGEDFDRALFQATFSNFLEEIFEKQLQANKLQLDLIRIYEGKAQNVGSHMHIIKNCRKTIETTDCIIKDTREYFTDLKIPQIYCLFETLFRNLVYTLKTLSQCYLHRFDGNRLSQVKLTLNGKKSEEITTQSPQIADINLLCLYQSSKDKKKQDARKMEHLDFFINSIQAKQTQLQNQMHTLIANVKDEKQRIQKIDSTIRSSFYEEMRKIFSDISNKAQYIFNNHLKTQNDQDKSQKYMKPEDFQYQIYSQLRRDTKFAAKKKFEEIFNIIVNIFKQKLQKKFQIKQAQLLKTAKNLKKQKQGFMKSQKSRRYVKIKSQKSLKKKESEHDTSLQKQVNEKLAIKIQQNINLLKQIQLLKRQTKILNYQIEQLKLGMKKQKSQFAKLQFQNKELQKLFKKRTIELEQSKNQIHRTINKRVRESAILSSKGSEQNQGGNIKYLKSIPHKILFEQKQIQTQQITNFTQDLFNCSMAFEHKSFVSIRTKHRRKSTNKEDSINQKNKLTKTESNLKMILEKVSDLLFKQKINQQNQEQKCNLFNLIQSQNYDQAIEVMKEKLDNLFITSKKGDENQTATKKGANKKSKPSKKKNQNKTKKVFAQQLNINSVKFIHFGVQTEFKKQNDESKSEKHSPKQTTIHSSYQQKQNRKKIATISTLEQRAINYKKVNSKTQRVSPICSLVSKFNSQLDKKGKQNLDDKKLINIFRKSQGQSLLKQSQPNQNENQTIKKKNKFLQNSLFEQINIKNNESTTTSRRNNMLMKTPRLKFKQSNNQLERQENIKAVPELHEDNKQRQDQRSINFDSLKLKKVDRIDSSLETTKSIEPFKQFNHKSKQQYEKNVLGMLTKQNETKNNGMSDQAIEKFRCTRNSDLNDYDEHRK